MQTFQISYVAFENIQFVFIFTTVLLVDVHHREVHRHPFFVGSNLFQKATKHPLTFDADKVSWVDIFWFLCRKEEAVYWLVVLMIVVRKEHVLARHENKRSFS